MLEPKSLDYKAKIELDLVDNAKINVLFFYSSTIENVITPITNDTSKTNDASIVCQRREIISGDSLIRVINDSIASWSKRDFNYLGYILPDFTSKEATRRQYHRNFKPINGLDTLIINFNVLLLIPSVRQDLIRKIKIANSAPNIIFPSVTFESSKDSLDGFVSIRSLPNYFVLLTNDFHRIMTTLSNYKEEDTIVITDSSSISLISEEKPEEKIEPKSETKKGTTTFNVLLNPGFMSFFDPNGESLNSNENSLFTHNMAINPEEISIKYINIGFGKSVKAMNYNFLLGYYERQTKGSFISPEMSNFYPSSDIKGQSYERRVYINDYLETINEEEQGVTLSFSFGFAPFTKKEKFNFYLSPTLFMGFHQQISSELASGVFTYHGYYSQNLNGVDYSREEKNLPEYDFKENLDLTNSSVSYSDNNLRFDIDITFGGCYYITKYFGVGAGVFYQTALTQNDPPLHGETIKISDKSGEYNSLSNYFNVMPANNFGWNLSLQFKIPTR